LSSDNTSFSTVISACGNSHNWASALTVLYSMDKVTCAPNSYCRSAGISACNKGQQWQQALNLYEEFKACNQPASIVVCNAVIRACGHSGQRCMIADLLCQIPEQQLRPDEQTFNAAITAYGDHSHWEDAMHLFSAAKPSHGILLSNVLLRAYERSSNWERMLAFFLEIESSTSKLDRISYLSTIGGLWNSANPSEAVALYRVACEKRLLKHWLDCNTIDLHFHSKAVAEVAVAVALIDLTLGRTNIGKGLYIMTGKTRQPQGVSNAAFAMLTEREPRLSFQSGRIGFKVSATSLRNWLQGGR